MPAATARKVLSYIGDAPADPSRLVNKMELPGGQHPMMTPDARDYLENFLRTKLGVTPMEAAITGGGALALTGAAGLGGADGGEALGSALLGAGVAAAPVIHNEFRNPKFRTAGLRLRGRDLTGILAAGAGVGAGTSLLLDAAGQ